MMMLGFRVAVGVKLSPVVALAIVGAAAAPAACRLAIQRRDSGPR